MIIKKIIFLFFALIVCIGGNAQVTNNKYNKQLFVTSDTLQLDTLSIVPESIVLLSKTGQPLDPSLYKINYVEGKVIFKQKIMDSLRVSYQTFPYLFSKENNHKNINIIKPDLHNKNNPFGEFNYNVESNDNDIFKMEGLDKSGSISRGISFGNTQNMVVNSNLNLQLSGKLSNDVDILLAATDNNIPIQPQGNTQQLQEFDKVFIQLSRNNTKLIAGDFQMTRPNSYFMNFYKKAQGLNFSTAVPIHTKNKSNMVYKTALVAGVSRGKFSRNKIQGIESNQGPYRLKGAENETYIVILSGTERVYIDGRLLTRGQENDYIIDYNSSSITFTAKQLITKDKRIIVEFQYSDQNYARSLVHFGNDFETKKVKVHVNLYSEQDSKNQPLKQNLTDPQKKILSQVGDTLLHAVSPSYDSVPFSNTEVLYKKVDTIINAVQYSIFEYSTNSDSSHWRVTFSNVGPGNGNYIQVVTNANGKVYQWVAPNPITHQMNGSYEPVILLITPKQKQMLTVGVDYALNKKTKVSVEGVGTNNNLNTFSSIDKKDDVGYGLKANIDNKQPLKNDTTSKELALLTNVNYEYVQKYFSPIERYRSIEFERDWNRPNTNILNDQHIVGGGLQLVKKETGNIGYKLSEFIENNNYNGIKHYGNLGWKKNGLKVNYDGSLLNSKSKANTSFYRHLGGVSQDIKGVTVGLKDYFEQNKFILSKKDSLLSNSYQFWEWQVFAQNTDTTKNKYGIYYKQRTDDSVKNHITYANLQKVMIGKSYGAFMELNKNPHNQLKINATYRTLQIVDTTITSQKPDNTLLSRIEYNFRLLKGLINSNLFYEIGSGLEVKQQFSYIEVAAGQGVYTWIDYNNNGVKELNEFEVAAFPSSATYIRVFTPTSQYIKVYNNQFSEQITIKPAAVWANKTGIRKFVARFANQTAYRVDRKTMDKDYTRAYNPFLPESQTINNSVVLNSSLRNTFFINQLSPVFGLDLTYQNLKNISLLISGLDMRQNVFEEARLRWNMTRQLSWLITYKTGKKDYVSQYFETKNYSIAYFEAEPKFNFQPTTAFRLTLSYKYSNKQNSPLYGSQRAELNNYGVEIKYNILQTGSLNAKINMIQISYTGQQNTSLAFEMLESLQIGQNYTWGLAYQRNLSNNMQLSITYDGRKTQTGKPVHVGGAQIRAYF